jgi:hypothetical protein
VVFEVSDDGSGEWTAEDDRDDEVRLRRSFDGSVTTWTPSLDSCLERGAHYGWSVRAVDAVGDGAWSEPLLFRLESGPTDAELDEALAVVRAYAASRRASLSDSSSSSSSREAGEKTVTTERSPAPKLHAGVGSHVVINGAIAETKADLPCVPASDKAADAGDRFIDCGNGTVHDTATGLLWLKSLNCLPDAMSWYDAQAFVANMRQGSCGLSDHSQRGDWRLPTSTEWSIVLKSSCSDPPKLEGKSGGCFSDLGGSWAVAVRSACYWSFNTYAPDPTTAEYGSTQTGGGGFFEKTFTCHVWPVRDVR